MKIDLWLSVVNALEWCARYWNVTESGDETNWELYLGDRLIAYNYNVANAYIVSYSSTGSFMKGLKLEVNYVHRNKTYYLIKKYDN